MSKKARMTRAREDVEVGLLAEIMKDQMEPVKHCSCGNVYKDDAVFCRKCGRKRDAALERAATMPSSEGVLVCGSAPLPGAESQPLLQVEPEREQTSGLDKVWWLVHDGYLERIACVMVLLNILFLGVETDLKLKSISSPFWSEATEFMFCLFFSLELSLRMWFDGGPYEFLTSTDARWAWMDTSLVLMQIVDQFTYFLDITGKGFSSTSIVRITRLLRALRITRTLRMVHLSKTLSANVAVLCSSAWPACWSFGLFVLMVYMFTIILVQMAEISSGSALAQSDDLEAWFSDLHRSLLTVFQVFTFGVNWNDVVVPLYADVSPFVGTIFCVMVVTGMFVVTSLFLNLFSDRIMRSVREDKDVNLQSEISNMFVGDTQAITWDTFASKLQKPAMIEFFDSIDVCPTVDQARSLFHPMYSA